MLNCLAEGELNLCFKKAKSNFNNVFKQKMWSILHYLLNDPRMSILHSRLSSCCVSGKKNSGFLHYRVNAGNDVHSGVDFLCCLHL